MEMTFDILLFIHRLFKLFNITFSVSRRFIK
jgi:hypothetical protein